jgi:hypothetical protein
VTIGADIAVGELLRSSDLRMGTVTQVSPLLVRADGDQTAQPATPPVGSSTVVGARALLAIGGAGGRLVVAYYS